RRRRTRRDGGQSMV
ncbi:RHS Repeat family protein, partial [Escherichia coli 3.4870]